MNITEVPNSTNLKNFMVFDGQPSDTSFLFDGNISQFSTTFFTDATWETIQAWADENEYLIIMEGSAEYTEFTELFANQDFFDMPGDLTELGIFDDQDDIEKYLNRTNVGD